MLPQSIIKPTTPIGTVDGNGHIIMSRDWYLFFQQLYQYTMAGNYKTSDAVLLESADADLPPILNLTGSTGAQTATFTATNKPGTGTTAPTIWITAYVDGTVYYVPGWK